MDEDFIEWLKKERGYSEKSASDAASRCRRVQKAFNVSLKDVLSKKDNLEKMRERVTKETSRLVKGDANKYVARAAHRLAVKLYSQFLHA